MHKSQLYTLSNNDYRLPLAIDLRGKTITANADNIPMMSWPNNRWCFEANIYMLELYEKGLNRRNGGTLKSYAANISHLIRYCFYNQTDFINLSDSQFVMFIKGLQGEQKNLNSSVRKRNANTIISIGRNCLAFLNFVGQFYNQYEFVNKNGRIRAEQKEFQIKIEGRHRRKTLLRKYWHHNALPAPDSKIKVLPINTNNIKKLRTAIGEISNSLFIKYRRRIMLMLLEVTGGRRGEIASLTIKSVKRACEMQEPMLELITLKRRGDPIRMIPIPRIDLDMLSNFIEKQRRYVIKNTLGLSDDHGYVFISETTGKPIKAQTISQEIFALAKAAGIEEKVHAHMFRHRFITKLFVALIEHHSFVNVDDFRRALLDTTSMMQKVQQWTGHSNLASLEIYINLAFDELSSFNKTYDAVILSRLIDSIRNHVALIRSDVNNDMSPGEVMSQVLLLLDNLEHGLAPSVLM